MYPLTYGFHGRFRKNAAGIPLLSYLGKTRELFSNMFFIMRRAVSKDNGYVEEEDLENCSTNKGQLSEMSFSAMSLESGA